MILRVTKSTYNSHRNSHSVCNLDLIFRICSILNTVQCIHSSIADWDDISPYNKILNSNPDFQTKHDDAVRNLQNLSQNIIRILIYNAVDSDVW